MITLALCHTVITEVIEDKIIYNASSPDELALLNFAKFLGYEFLGIDDHNNMEIRYEEEVFKYSLVHVLEFNSTRKRMSVIVKDSATGAVTLLCKGADSIIEKRLTDKTDAEFLSKT